MHQSNSIGRAVLDTIHGIVETHRAKTVGLIRDDARKHERVVRSATRAIVEHEGVICKISACRSGDFYEFAYIAAHIIVVDFIDPNAFDLHA